MIFSRKGRLAELKGRVTAFNLQLCCSCQEEPSRGFPPQSFSSPLFLIHFPAIIHSYKKRLHSGNTYFSFYRTKQRVVDYSLRLLILTHSLGRRLVLDEGKKGQPFNNSLCVPSLKRLLCDSTNGYLQTGKEKGLTIKRRTQIRLFPTLLALPISISSSFI